jgi:hypothetical protein
MYRVIIAHLDDSDKRWHIDAHGNKLYDMATRLASTKGETVEHVIAFIASVIGSAILGGIITAIANGPFDQSWNFLIVWVIVFVVMICGWVAFSVSDGEISID